jgi:hypothetical protein
VNNALKKFIHLCLWEMGSCSSSGGHPSFTAKKKISFSNFEVIFEVIFEMIFEVIFYAPPTGAH